MDCINMTAMSRRSAHSAHFSLDSHRTFLTSDGVCGIVRPILTGLCKISIDARRLVAVVLITALAAARVVGASEIHDAVRARDIKKVRQLLAATTNLVNTTTPEGCTPLHVAASTNAADIASLLLDAGADIDARTGEGYTALKVAMDSNAEGVVKVLITKTPAAYTDRFLDVRHPEGKKARDSGELHRAYGLFTNLVRQDPGNEDINFAYGLLCYSLGGFSRAKMAFERVVQINPGNDRARMELGRICLEMAQLESAQEQFEAVLAHKLPANIRQYVENQLKLISKAVKKWQVSCRVDVGAFIDDNVNVGPDSEIIDITPIIFGSTVISSMSLGEDSLPVETEGFLSTVALSGAYDVGKKGEWNLFADGIYYQNWLNDRPSNEALYWQTAVGLGHMGVRRMLRVPLTVAHINSGHEPLMNMYGINPTLLYVCGPKGKLQWITSTGAEIRRYDELTTRDGFYVSGGETMKRIFGKAGGHSISIGGSVAHDHTDSKVYRYIALAGNIGLEMSLPWDATLYSRGSYTVTDYDEKELLAPEERSDNQIQVTVGLSKKIGGGWGIDINHQLTDNDSTFDLYQYDRNVTTISTFCAF